MLGDLFRWYLRGGKRKFKKEQNKLLYMMYHTDHNRMLKKLKLAPHLYSPLGTQEDVLRTIERIYNYNTKLEPVRLF